MTARGNMAGLLRRRVTLQQPEDTPDGAGGFARNWADVAEVWADIRPAQGSEKLEGLQLQWQVTHRVTLRYRAGVTTAMRLLESGRAFNIRAVMDRDEGHAVLDVLAEEGAAD
jgi:SPP1 family predicted phage head-tail adaptor